MRLWPELNTVPTDFVLYGGTGLALQIGHRSSEDFDFFSTSGFDPSRLQSRLPFFRDLDGDDADAWVHFKTDNLEAFIDRDGPVKVAFFGGLDRLQRVQNPLRAAGSRVLVADGTLDRVPENMKRDLTRWARQIDLEKLPVLRAEPGLSPGGMAR